jgi:hypothetical protein
MLKQAMELEWLDYEWAGSDARIPIALRHRRLHICIAPTSAVELGLMQSGE